ncbi:MAG TPA: DEAD/DEAH box helicase [Hyphomonadaceae bacterium]|nr:DEAD/DEAH box helicase [Hyphomonadaceae bacterium]HPI49378.1 DEAD/DEAH box helicase [Hyphomonadaceae bacterium]
MPFPAVHPALDRALAARGYAEPTPVQLAVVEADQKAGRPNADMLVSAQTGSGKTVAFGLALASTLFDGQERFGPATQPLALIIAPTRELAMQIGREFEWLYADTGARIVQCVGGMSVRGEQQQLSRGAHIVIGTPGRLCDHLTKGYLDLSTLKVAVLDEADEMLDLGFREELEQLLDATNAETRRTLLFSATIARGIAMLAKNYQRDAVRIDTTSATEPHGDIDYRAMRVSPGDTERAVVNVLRFFEAGSALVFCATRENVRHLHSALRERGFHAVGLSGEMNQRERNDALQSLRDGHAKVCVATDVAARGLDLPDLGLVIHADLPTNKATLLHRSGRTGRAGKKGTSVLLVTHTKRRRTEQVLASANIEATWSGPPTAKEIRDQDRQRLLGHPALEATVSEEDLVVAKQLAERFPAEKLAGALIGMLRSELPEPEDVSDDGRMRNAQTFEKQSGQSERTFREPSERPAARSRSERGFATSEGDGVWFRLNVGRERNADPKWILPLICRVGHITKAEIGPIRIFGTETKFEIVGHAAEAFAIAVQDTQDDKIQIEPSSAPGPNDNIHPARARRDDGARADRAPRDFGDRPPREKRAYGDRPQREPRGEDKAPREFVRRSARDDARAERHIQRDRENANLAADPVYSALTSSAPPAPKAPKGPPPAHPSGQNRRERRDAARAEGKIAAIGVETPKRTWTPEGEARPVRTERPATERRERTEHRKPEGFKPRGPKAPGGKPFKARGDKPSFGGKSFGGKPGGKPFRGKPAGKRDGRS